MADSSLPRIVGFLFVTVATPLSGQVGHRPESSPYRDLRWGQFVSLSAGKAFGSGGTLGVGPHDGTILWARHEFLADRPLSIALGGGWGKLDRTYGDLQATTNRVKGPIRHNVYFAEGTLQLNLTGGKTWNHLAPYLGAGLGLAFSEDVPQDSSGYRFGTKFYLAPNVGVRAFVTRRLFLRLEARAIFWNLNHGESYRVTDPDGFGPLLPLLAGQPIKEWSPLPMIHAGVGYAFRRPF